MDIEKQRRPASQRDIDECGWLQTQFPESFGCGGPYGFEPGIDGHLWIMIPVEESSASIAARGAGLTRSLHDIFKNPNPRDWKLAFAFYKFNRGFFCPPVWVASVKLMNSHGEFLLGFIAVIPIKQFGSDISRMLEIGIPTFDSVPDGCGQLLMFRYLRNSILIDLLPKLFPPGFRERERTQA